METAETHAEGPGQTSGPPPLPTGKPWGFWATLGLTLVNIICSLASGVSVFFAITFCIWILDDEAEFYETAHALLSGGIAGWYLAFTVAGTGLGLTVLFVRLSSSSGIVDYLGLHPVNLRTLGFWLAVEVCCTIFISVAGEHLASGARSQHISLMFRYFPLGLVGLTMLLGCYAAILIWGFLYRGCSETILGRYGTVVLISLLPGVLLLLAGHALSGTLLTLALGLIGWARVRTGSVYVPVAMYTLSKVISDFIELARTLPEQ